MCQMNRMRKASSLWLGVLGVLVLWLSIPAHVLAASQPAAPSAQGRIIKTYNEGKKLRGQEAVKFADEFLALANDPKLLPRDKVFALEWGIYFCNCNKKIDGACAKAHEIFEAYRRDLVGKSPTSEKKLVYAYVSEILGAELAKDGNRLGEFLKVIDENEKTLNFGPDKVCADLCRGQLYLSAREWEKATGLLEGYVASSTTPDPQVYGDISQAYLALKRPQEAVAALTAGMKRFEADPTSIKKLTPMLRYVDESQVVDILPYCVRDGATADSVLAGIAQRTLQSGNVNGALAYAKLCYSTAPIEGSTAAMELVAKCLTAVDMDPTKATQFLQFQKYGVAGEDGKVGTADDCRDDLASIPNPLPAHVTAALEDRLKGMIPAAGSIYTILRDRGAIYLVMGKSKEALRSFRSAYDAASIAEVKEGSALVPRALKSLDGTVVRANAYLLYQKHGPNGPDGQRGTADDINDPLADDILPELPQDVQNALLAITANKAQTVAAYQQRGFAWLALGEYEKGLDQLRGAFVFAAQGKGQAEAIEGIAAAIKAFDGHVLRANQYLLFQSHGANGPDKKLGTEDDLANPFPAILKEIKKTEAARVGA